MEDSLPGCITPQLLFPQSGRGAGHCGENRVREGSHAGIIVSRDRSRDTLQDLAFQLLEYLSAPSYLLRGGLTNHPIVHQLQIECVTLHPLLLTGASSFPLKNHHSLSIYLFIRPSYISRICYTRINYRHKGRCLPY